jgi:hypothetical protein
MNLEMIFYSILGGLFLILIGVSWLSHGKNIFDFSWSAPLIKILLGSIPLFLGIIALYIYVLSVRSPFFFFSNSNVRLTGVQHVYLLIGSTILLVMGFVFTAKSARDYIRELKTGTKKCIGCGTFSNDVVYIWYRYAICGPWCRHCAAARIPKKSFLPDALLMVIYVIIAIACLVSLITFLR